MSSHPFVLSVLVLDAFGGAVHRWIGGMASLFRKSLKFFVESAEFSEAFLFPLKLQIKYFSRVYSKFVLSLVCLFR